MLTAKKFEITDANHSTSLKAHFDMHVRATFAFINFYWHFTLSRVIVLIEQITKTFISPGANFCTCLSF